MLPGAGTCLGWYQDVEFDWDPIRGFSPCQGSNVLVDDRHRDRRTTLKRVTGWQRLGSHQHEAQTGSNKSTRRAASKQQATATGQERTRRRCEGFQFCLSSRPRRLMDCHVDQLTSLSLALTASRLRVSRLFICFFMLLAKNCTSSGLADYRDCGVANSCQAWVIQAILRAFEHCGLGYHEVPWWRCTT